MAQKAPIICIAVGGIAAPALAISHVDQLPRLTHNLLIAGSVLLMHFIGKLITR